MDFFARPNKLRRSLSSEREMLATTTTTTTGRRRRVARRVLRTTHTPLSSSNRGTTFCVNRRKGRRITHRHTNVILRRNAFSTTHRFDDGTRASKTRNVNTNDGVAKRGTFCVASRGVRASSEDDDVSAALQITKDPLKEETRKRDKNKTSPKQKLPTTKERKKKKRLENIIKAGSTSHTPHQRRGFSI